jgi:uncharacterized protein (TIGR03086 family)
MTPVDLEPAARRMAELVSGVADDRLDQPTPCPGYTLGDLLDHVGGLAIGFTSAATKAGGDAGSRGPAGDASRLESGWRTRIVRDLVGMAEAWRDPAAWSGMTRAGGVDLPGEVAGLVALDELVVHGWDVTRASEQPDDCDEESLEAVQRFLVPMAGPGQAALREGLFGPVVEVAVDAPLLDRVIGLTGRQPAWRGVPVRVDDWVASMIVELAQQDSGGRRTVRVGESVVVALPENPTTGYRWHADVDEAALQPIDDGYDGPAGLRGASGVRRLAFTALRAGPTRLRLVKRRSWEAKAVEEFAVDLDVKV